MCSPCPSDSERVIRRVALLSCLLLYKKGISMNMIMLMLMMMMIRAITIMMIMGMISVMMMMMMALLMVMRKKLIMEVDNGA